MNIGEVELDFLEVDHILDCQFINGHYLYLVQWKRLQFTSWVKFEYITSLHVLLQYYCQLIGDDDEITGLSPSAKAEQLVKIFGECTSAEIDAIVQRHLTINGLKLPFSNGNSITEHLIYRLKNNITPSISDMKKIRDSIILEKVIKKRQDQLTRLKKTEFEINLINDNSGLITISNLIDLETLPDHFVYINNYIPGKGVHIPSDPPIWCDCAAYGCSWYKKNAQKGHCCPNISDSQPAYDENKRIILKNKIPIYECNKKCTCDKSCPNRVVQNGSNIRFEIFRTFNQCGWGVRTLDDIPSGTFVARYVGEVITYDEAEKRSKEYLFDIDFNYARESDICPYTVDAFKYGNLTRFINHSCDPNLSVYGVLIDCLDPDFHEIAFFASRDIIAGEEISFNYRKLMQCKCGSINCKLK